MIQYKNKFYYIIKISFEWTHQSKKKWLKIVLIWLSQSEECNLKFKKMLMEEIKYIL